MTTRRADPMQVLIRYEANLDIGPSIGLDGYKHGVPVRNRTSMREQEHFSNIPLWPAIHPHTTFSF
jgi:hypothetical protein